MWLGWLDVVVASGRGQSMIDFWVFGAMLESWLQWWVMIL